MAEDDASLGESQRNRGFDEFLFLEREDLTANDAGHREPFDRSDADEEEPEFVAEVGREDDDDDEEREAVEDIDDAHHDGVGAAAEVAGSGTVDDADGEGDGRGEQSDAQRDAATVENAREDVATEVVASKEVGDFLAFAGGGVGEGAEGFELGMGPVRFGYEGGIRS